MHPFIYGLLAILRVTRKCLQLAIWSATCKVLQLNFAVKKKKSCHNSTVVHVTIVCLLSSILLLLDFFCWQPHICWLSVTQLPSCPVAQLSNSCGTVKPKYSEGPRDWYNLFAIKRFRYGEVLFHIINIVLSVFVIPRTLLYRSRFIISIFHCM